jgi:hypothetical protein
VIFLADRFYSQEYKDYILNLYKKEFEAGNVTSINDFVNNYPEEKIKEEFKEEFSRMTYMGFYKWTKKRDDLEGMKGEPVQKTKNHEKQSAGEVKEEVEEEKEEVEGGEELELEKRIEEVDRIETENPESKENRKKSEEVVEKTSSKLNIDSSKLYIGAGVLSAVVLAFMLYSKFKNNKNKEVVPDVQQRQQTAETERQKSRYPTPGEL